ncbi:MAG: pyruvate kinase, partial [Deltaproteobacteria bacterium]|nr:pyruvate kinase [Deltaproteobacteria bacterium]
MVLENKTKIIATLGPASFEEKVIKQLLEAGANILRINCSHNTPEQVEVLVEKIHRIREASGYDNVGILLDLPGPKLRLAEIENGSVFLETNSLVTLKAGMSLGNKSVLFIKSLEKLDFVKPNDHIFIDDGKIVLQVQEVLDETTITAKVVQGGEIKNSKGVDFPTSPIPGPDLTDKDFEFLDMACKLPVDFLAISFVRNANTIKNVKQVLVNSNKDIWVIAKIERKEALNEIDAILEVADAIMIARGDLALAVPPEQLPIVQIRLIEKANDKAVPVIVATQMLLSMVKNRTPTRAEVSDVSYSVMQGADAVMLSDETSVGEYPVLSVQMMKRIVVEALQNFNFDQYKSRLTTLGHGNIVEAVCYAAAAASFKLNSKAIVACTTSGYSVKLLTKYRPKPP